MTADAPATTPDPVADPGPQLVELGLALRDLERVAAQPLTTEERADLDGALMHLAKVQRSLQARRDGRGA